MWSSYVILAFSCTNIVSIWVRSASRMPGKAVPAPHQLPIQPVTERLYFAERGSRVLYPAGGCFAGRYQKRRAPRRHRSAAKRCRCGGAAPCDGESLIGGILRRAPTPARCALRSWKLRPSAADANQRRPRRRSRHLHKTRTEPGHMAGPPAGRKRVSLSQLCGGRAPAGSVRMPAALPGGGACGVAAVCRRPVKDPPRQFGERAFTGFPWAPIWLWGLVGRVSVCAAPSGVVYAPTPAALPAASKAQPRRPILRLRARSLRRLLRPLLF